MKYTGRVTYDCGCWVEMSPLYAYRCAEHEKPPALTLDDVSALLHCVEMADWAAASRAWDDAGYRTIALARTALTKVRALVPSHPPAQGER